MRQIAEFEWDNPNNNIDITNRTEINDLFWRATEEYGFEYVETDEQLKDFISQGKIVVDKNKITFFE
jgi:hypothetical protein